MKKQVFSSNKYIYLIKNTGILAIGNFSSKILIFFLVPLYTSALTTAEYGTADLIISIVTLIMPILTANIMGAVMRFMMDKSCDRNVVSQIGFKYLTGGWLTGILLCGTAYAIYLLMPDKITSLSGEEIRDFLWIIYTYFLFYSLYQFLLQISKGIEKVKEIAIAGVIGSASLIGFNILFLLYFKLGIKGFLISYVISQALPSLYLLIKLILSQALRKTLSVNKSQKKFLTKKMLQYSVPLIFVDLGWWVNNSLDKFTVTAICGSWANGLLATAYKVPSILNVVQQIFIQAWQISAIKEADNKSSIKFYRQCFLYLNAVMCIGCCVLTLLVRPIAHIMFASDFYKAWQYVPFLLVSSVFNCAAGFIGPLLAAKRDSKSMAKSAFWGAGVNVILNITLTLWLGIQGTCIATAVASFVIYLVRKKATGNVLDGKASKYILFSWVILCADAAAVIYFNRIGIILSTIFLGVVIGIYIKSIKKFKIY